MNVAKGAFSWDKFDRIPVILDDKIVGYIKDLSVGFVPIENIELDWEEVRKQLEFKVEMEITDKDAIKTLSKIALSEFSIPNDIFLYDKEEFAKYSVREPLDVVELSLVDIPPTCLMRQPALRPEWKDTEKGDEEE